MCGGEQEHFNSTNLYCSIGGSHLTLISFISRFILNNSCVLLHYLKNPKEEEAKVRKTLLMPSNIDCNLPETIAYYLNLKWKRTSNEKKRGDACSRFVVFDIHSTHTNGRIGIVVVVASSYNGEQKVFIAIFPSCPSNSIKKIKSSFCFVRALRRVFIRCLSVGALCLCRWFVTFQLDHNDNSLKITSGCSADPRTKLNSHDQIDNFVEKSLARALTSSLDCGPNLLWR